ncbi:NUDIX hydrolase [Pseudonocardia humida]|uniref:NUDIX domain-containing protein n=1 Tax=Pseudonocardia humida TaxID=2800819 RepID=A0ABT1A926_9PSEU|nr:NUDIX domain-containing protein [Pseudonocardia humida]MCO1659498.1 NUDIX domain-containing protein [Pseudonocardia humida]
MRKRVRAGAYVVCVRDGAVLLAGGVEPTGGTEWTLPGGGLDHGEQPHEGAVREVAEETGYAVRLDALLTVDAVRVSTHHVPPYDLHAVRIIYAGTVVGGDLRFEVGGSTDRAAWVPLGEVPGLVRSSVIDVGLAAWGQSTSTP